MIKYTEDIADKDLERQLLRRVSSAASHQNGSTKFETEEENVRVTTSEKKKITIRMQNEEVATTIGLETIVEVAKTTVLSESTPPAAGSPQQTSTANRPTARALHPLAHQVIRREPVPRPSIGQIKSNSSSSSAIKRAALPVTRTPQSQASDDFDDFPQARPSAPPSSSSKTPSIPKKIPARPIGLSASRAPSVRQPAKQKLVALSSSTRGVPLSQSLAARGKRVRTSDVIVLGETVNDDSPPSSPTASAQMVQDHPSFSTPPRPIGGMLSSGSSVRRRSLVDTGSSSGLLVTLLRNARARTIQDWSSMAAAKSGVMVKTDAQMNIQIKAIRVFTSIEHVTVECRVLDRGSEESVAIGDCLTCIIPYYPYDPKDTSTKMTLHNLGHVSVESNLDGALLTIHRPWKVLTLPDSGARLIICSGLVTSVPSDLVEMSSSTG